METILTTNSIYSTLNQNSFKINSSLLDYLLLLKKTSHRHTLGKEFSLLSIIEDTQYTELENAQWKELWISPHSKIQDVKSFLKIFLTIHYLLKNFPELDPLERISLCGLIGELGYISKRVEGKSWLLLSFYASNSPNSSHEKMIEPDISFKIIDNHIVELAFVDISFGEIPILLHRFKHLRSLKLSNSFLFKIPLWLKDFQALKHLDLSRNFLKSNLFRISKLSSLETINLSHNHFVNISGIFQANNLKSINLSANSIKYLPHKILSNTSLNSLDISNNRLETVPDSIINFVSLNRLDLTGNPLRLPWSIFIANAPDKYLLLIREYIHRKAAHWSRADIIQKIIKNEPLDFHEIYSPKSIKNKDEIMDAVINHKEYIKSTKLDELFRFERHTTLFYNQKKMDKDRAYACVAFLLVYSGDIDLDIRFELFYSSENNYHLPKEELNALFKLPEILKDQESYHPLNQFKVKISHNHVLELNLDNYKIDKFPPILKKFTHLNTLSLRYNNISHIPQWVHDLKDLKHLDLCFNHFREFPSDFSQITKFFDRPLLTGKIT